MEKTIVKNAQPNWLAVASELLMLLWKERSKQRDEFWLHDRYIHVQLSLFSLSDYFLMHLYVSGLYFTLHIIGFLPFFHYKECVYLCFYFLSFFISSAFFWKSVVSSLRIKHLGKESFKWGFMLKARNSPNLVYTITWKPC